ncbi:P-loop containing nucleoside triphosphate hydrolase protein [Nemania sp. FL0916]|nr:P-loop containing nucleoside triphosphate hydrolase protein [Nemania sp. FL0916]
MQLPTEDSNIAPTSSDPSDTIALELRGRQPTGTCAAVAEPVHEDSNSISGSRSSTLSDQSKTTDDKGSGIIRPALAGLGIEVKEYNDALMDIRPLGISHVAVLPELILVGDQSSGKSSLMSALAQLKKEYDYCPPPTRRIKQFNVNKNQPFPPWVEKSSTETITFKTIYEHEGTVDIAEILRWAQLANLNPSQNPKQFVPSEGSYAKETSLETAQKSSEARFSPNVVLLEMKGPTFTDASFVDLPGIFAISDVKEDDYLVEVVANLTRKYVSCPEAIIMLALPMDQDIDNSKTLKVIRELNAESRTIGIITKADRPNFNIRGTIDYWLAVLNEKKQKVKENGFYITSLPPDKTFDGLAAWEESFFRAGLQNWPHEFDEFVHRCGIAQLRPFLKKELGNAFAGSLPVTKQRLQARLHEVQCQLNELPDLPENVEHEVRTKLKNLYRTAQQAPLETAEQPAGQTPRPKPQLGPKQAVIISVSEDSENESMKTKRAAPRGANSTPKRRRLCDIPPATAVKSETKSAAASLSDSPPGSKSQEMKLSLLEIRKNIELTTRGGFGDVIPFQIHESLCLGAVSQWERVVENYIDSATKLLKKAIIRALKMSLAEFSKRLIYEKSVRLLTTIVDKESAYQRGRLMELYRNETYRAVTINEGGLNDIKCKEKELLENRRLFTRAQFEGLIDEDEVFKLDEEMSREEKLEQSKLLDRMRKQLPEDDFQREIDVAAKVRAYYSIAVTRFVDNCSIDLNSQLFRHFRDEELDSFMDKELGLFPYPTQETYARLMEEDAETAQRRDRLKKEESQLETAVERIVKLERTLTGVAPHADEPSKDGKSEN